MDDIQTYPQTASAVACELASARGWHVFPCLGDKRPACPHGFQDASADQSTIQRLWRDFPGSLIGIATGEVSGFDVLDLDLIKHPEAVRFANTQAKWLAGIPRCQTRSGGEHFYFAHSEGLKCSVGKPVPGVDVRADGGYVVWWPAVPSITQQGGPMAPHIAATRDLPLWPLPLLRELRPPPPPIVHRPKEAFPGDITALLRLVETAPKGQRNSILFWSSCRAGEMIRAGTIDRGTCERWLIAAGEYAGLSQREAWATVKSGLERQS